MCDFFEVSRQAYYKGLKQRERQAIGHELIIELVQLIRRDNKKMGCKKLYSLLQADIHDIDVCMGRDKFFGLLRRRGLLVQRHRKYAVTTQSQHWFRVYTNKLQGFIPGRSASGVGMRYNVFEVKKRICVFVFDNGCVQSQDYRLAIEQPFRS